MSKLKETEMNEIKFPKFKDYTDQKVNFIQPKMDGHLAKIKKSSGGGIEVLTKNDKDITLKLLEIGHIEQELANLPNNSQILAEMHCPGIFASSVPTLLNDADERLQLTVFAAPLIHDVDMTKANLKTVMEILYGYGLNVSKTFDLVVPILSELRKETLLQEAVEEKFEGWVLKQSHMEGWYKLKPVKTIDGFVTATYKSTSDSFPGGLKRIQVGIWNDDGTVHNLGNVGNGFKKPYRMQFMTQEEIGTARELFLKDKEVALVDAMEKFGLPRLEMNSLLNKVCEIAYDSVTAGKKLRFPRFIRWRDDKNMKNCTVEQLGD